MNIRYKLFTLFAIITGLTMLLAGLIYINDLKSLFEKQVEMNLAHDKEKTKEYLKSIKQSTQSLASTIAKSENVLSSLNLISKYEDPKNYSKETFDTEKYDLLLFTKQWLDTHSNLSISLYDNEKDLFLIRRNSPENRTGYVSYTQEGKSQFVLQNGTTLKEIPPAKEISSESLGTLSTFLLSNSYVFSFTKPVYFEKELLGFVRVCYNFNEKDVEELSRLLIYPKVFETADNKLLFPQNMTHFTQKLMENPDYTTKKNTYEENDNPLYAISLINEQDLNKSIDRAILKVILIGLGIATVIFIIVYWSINSIILGPIENLRLGIKKIKKNDFAQMENIKNDEFSKIIQEFNSLSTELSKNITFLENYKYVLDAGNIVSKSDLNGDITYVNDNFCSISGYSREELIGQPHSISRHPETPKAVFAQMWEYLHEKKTWFGTIKNKTKDGGFYWVNMLVHPILDEEGNTVEYIAARHDITELMEQREQLKTIAHTDALTGFGNRYKLLKDINDCQSQFMGIALLNIDQFTQLNDFYGHQFGDEVISSFGKSLDEYLKNEVGYFLYHLQGDEFVILGRVKKELFLEMIQRLSHALKNRVLHVKGETIPLNFTVALSFEDKNSLLPTVDMALKIARRKKQDIFVYTKEESLEDEYANNFSWTQKIKEAIEEDRIVPFFQPIAKTNTQTIEKYESLIRLKEKDGKVVSPFFFLDIAKQSRQYLDLTGIMLEKSFAYFADKPYGFSINLTIDDVLSEAMQKRIFNLLESYKGIGERLTFEIVESESIRDFEHVRTFIQDIKKYGCSIAIDDFGTGYSNFSYLMELRVDLIKIDGSLIRNIDANENHQAVVETIVMFAKKNSILTVAEFVASKEIYDKVKALDIDFIQGYYLGAPEESI